MTYLRATEYFPKLANLIEGVGITDEKGFEITLDDGMHRAVELVAALKPSGGKAMLIGNGGSAAIVSHMQNDLCKAVGTRAIVFNEPSLLTAFANDHGYPCVFEKSVELWADEGDLLIAVSSSGASASITRGVRAALAGGCRVITLSGFQPDNELRLLGHLNFFIASCVYGFVELAHGALAHCLTDAAAELSKRTMVDVQ